MDKIAEPIKDKRLPSSIKEIVLSEVAGLIGLLRRENNADYRVLLFTTVGTISGEINPCSHENEMIKYTDDPTNFTLDASSIFDRLQRRYKFDDFHSEAYSDAYMINVKNAIIYKSGMDKEVMRIEQMILFSDQIVGFSLIKNDMY